MKHLRCLSWVVAIASASCSSRDPSPPAVAGSGSAISPPKPGALSRDACARATSALLARSFTSGFTKPDVRESARPVLETACVEHAWTAETERCIAGTGDPWACIDVETARKLDMEPKPIATAPGNECSGVWPHVSAWDYTGPDDDTTNLVHRSLMETLTKYCSEQHWTYNTIECFERAETPAQLGVCMQLLTNSEPVAAAAKRVLDRARAWSTAKPLTCPQVVAKFYSREALANVQMPRYSAAEVAAAVRESEQELMKTCRESPVVMRRCFTDAADRFEQILCLDGNHYWETMPLFSALLSSKVAECDTFPALYTKCANASNGANGFLEGMAETRQRLYHAAPGSPEEADAIATCKALATKIQAAVAAGELDCGT